MVLRDDKAQVVAVVAALLGRISSTEEAKAQATLLGI